MELDYSAREAASTVGTAMAEAPEERPSRCRIGVAAAHRIRVNFNANRRFRRNESGAGPQLHSRAEDDLLLVCRRRSSGLHQSYIGKDGRGQAVRVMRADSDAHVDGTIQGDRRQGKWRHLSIGGDDGSREEVALALDAYALRVAFGGFHVFRLAAGNGSELDGGV